MDYPCKGGGYDTCSDVNVAIRRQVVRQVVKKKSTTAHIGAKHVRMRTIQPRFLIVLKVSLPRCLVTTDQVGCLPHTVVVFLIFLPVF